MRKVFCAAAVSVFVCALFSISLYGQDPVFEDRLFYTSFNVTSMPSYTQRRSNIFEVDVWQGKNDTKEKGTAVSEEAAMVSEVQEYFGVHHYHIKLFQTGATNHA